jgi:anthranilate synthase component 1
MHKPLTLYQRTLSADCDTPVSVFARLRDSGNCFLFESAEGGEHWGRYSIIGFEPSHTAIEQQHALHIQPRGGESVQHAGADILEWIRSEVIQRDATLHADGLPFSGGAVGYFAYDIIHRFEPGVPAHESDAPLAAFMLVDRFIVMDSLKGVMHLCVLGDEEVYARQQLDQIADKLQHNPTPEPMDLDSQAVQLATGTSGVQPHIPQGDFEAMVEKAKEFILAGDIFQVVLSQRFSTPLDCDPLAIYRAVRHINPSPYLFYLHIGDTILIGSSPEILVRKEDRRAIVRPIAGTRPRGNSDAEDLALEKDLLADAKELAEHVMLVDLGRNDLGRVCDYGSVQVSESMAIERYSHVMHIVSQVEGTLRDDVDALELLAATFPAGTLSGAPKIRAMQIIDELEPEGRGAYGGCIGYISFGGAQMDTAIIIRTAIIRHGMVDVQAGAGIVADSNPSSEHQECVNKATAMFRSVSLAQSQDTETTVEHR